MTDTEISDDEKRANDSLTAAAPALLAALKRCLPYVDRIRAMTGGEGDMTALNARAAIAAAKGESSVSGFNPPPSRISS